MNTRVIVGVVAGCFLGASVVGYSAAIGLPYTFSSGSPIKASEVNANFKSLSDRLDKLEGNTTVAADLVGTYIVNDLQSELHGDGTSSGEVDSYQHGGGKVVFNADGTGSFNAPESGYGLNAGTQTIWSKSTSLSGSWSYANGSVSFLGGNFTVVPGGKLLIRSSTNPADGTTVLIILTKIS